MRVEYLEPYYPSDLEKADPDLFAENVRALMVQRSGKVPVDISNYDALCVVPRACVARVASSCVRACLSCSMCAHGYAIRPQLADYMFQRLVTTVDTKEAMKLSKQHFSQLAFIADAFHAADSRAHGVLSLLASLAEACVTLCACLRFQGR